MSTLRHHPLIRVLHWLIAGLIIAAMVMSLTVMRGIPDDSPEKIDALRRHMAAGSLVLILTGLRFVMRREAVRPPALSSGMAWADWLARLIHRSFDALILLMVGSGIAMAILAGLPEIVFGGQGQLPDLEQLPLLWLHRAVGLALLGFLVLHAGGALFHQFILRDGLLSRMSFGLPHRRANEGDEAEPAPRSGR